MDPGRQKLYYGSSSDILRHRGSYESACLSPPSIFLAWCVLLFSAPRQRADGHDNHGFRLARLRPLRHSPLPRRQRHSPHRAREFGHCSQPSDRNGAVFRRREFAECHPGGPGAGRRLLYDAFQPIFWPPGCGVYRRIGSAGCRCEWRWNPGFVGVHERGDGLHSAGEHDRPKLSCEHQGRVLLESLHKP